MLGGHYFTGAIHDEQTHVGDEVTRGHPLFFDGSSFVCQGRGVFWTFTFMLIIHTKIWSTIMLLSCGNVHASSSMHRLPNRHAT
jgi:hypothetical protein